MKKLYRVHIALFLIACAACIHAQPLFETIDVLKAYAKSQPESVPMENEDYLNPQYVKYLDSQTPTAWDRMLMTVGLKHKPEWQPKPFIELLRRVTEKRKKDGFQGRFLQRQEVSQEDHFLVWGNLQGAYHSLVSTLEYLLEQKIIDKNLKIIAPKYFMVFSGNVIDRSVYSLETLTIVLRLLDVNPTRVFYVKGDHETNDLWQDYDFRDELEAKVAVAQGMLPPYKDGIVPFSADIDAFFDTLPLALYLGMKTVDSADGIRISHVTRSEFQITFDEMTYILNAVDKTVLPLPIAIPKERADEKPGSVVAMTEGNSDLIPNYTFEGLRLLPPDQGTTAWSILSAQTPCYQKLYKFLTDSYVDVTIALPMKKTSITQHYQDAHNRDGFKMGRVYNMFSGQSDEQFRAQTKIELVHTGTTLDLAGEAAILGRQVRDGMSLAINKQNQQGIVPGQIVTLTVLNDDHIFSRSRRNIEMLIDEYHTTIIMGAEENFMNRAYLDLVTQKDLLVLFPFTAVLKLRSAQYSNIIHYGPSYKDEAHIATHYILDTIAPNKIAIFYEKGQMGEDAFVGAKAVFKEKGFTSFTEIPFMSNVLDFKEQTAIIRRENPDAIAIFASASVAQEFIRQVGVQNISRRTLYGLSSLGAQSFRQYYKSRGLRIITTHLVPDPFRSDLPIVQDFRKEAKDNNVVISPQSLEAYIDASIFVEALRIIKGPITNQSIKQTLESMKDYAFKGLKLSFNKTTRELSNAIWLDAGDDSQPWKQFTTNQYETAEAPMGAEKPRAQEIAPLQKKAVPAPKVMAPAQNVEMPAQTATEVITPELENK